MAQQHPYNELKQRRKYLVDVFNKARRAHHKTILRQQIDKLDDQISDLFRRNQRTTITSLPNSTHKTTVER